MAGLLSFASSLVTSLLEGNRTPAYVTLSGSNGSVTFPVSPASFEVTSPYGNQVININNLGDVNMLGKRGLASISFSSLFPAQSYGWEVQQTGEDPYSSVERIQSMATSGQPCRLTISDTGINMACTVESLKYSEKDGSGDVYFSLELKEYRYIRPTAEEAINDGTGLKSRVASTVKEKTVTVYPGDDLMDVAARATGQLYSLDTQQKNRLQLAKQLIKNKELDAGDVLVATKTFVQVGDTQIKIGG